MRRDKFGYIGQIQADGSVEGGDSLCWNGHWEYLNKNNDRPRRIMLMENYRVGFGAYCRHPFDGMTNNGFGAYYKHPWDGVVSRDQMTGLLLGLIAEQNRRALFRVIIHWSFRFFLFAYNTRKNGADPTKTHWKFPDITGPDMWATALRGFGAWSWLFFPLLCVLDIHTLVNTIIHNHKQESDCINFAGKLMVSIDYVPTPISFLAYDLCDKTQLFNELNEYWSGWRQSPEFVEFYKPYFWRR